MKLFKQSFLLVISLVFFASQAHAVNTFNLINFSKAPKFLSEFGFFKDMRNQIPSEGVHPYSLVNPCSLIKQTNFDLYMFLKGKIRLYKR
jgi:hypothetical protein